MADEFEKARELTRERSREAQAAIRKQRGELERQVQSSLREVRTIARREARKQDLPLTKPAKLRVKEATRDVEQQAQAIKKELTALAREVTTAEAERLADIEKQRKEYERQLAILREMQWITAQTALQATTVEQADGVKVKDGYISREDYGRLSEKDKAWIVRVGVDAYNRIQVAEQKVFEAKNIQTKVGDWISRLEFLKLSETAQGYLMNYGIGAYNLLQKEKERFFKIYHTQLAFVNPETKEREWVDKKYYSSLSPAGQRYLTRYGTERFGAWASTHPVEALGLKPIEVFEQLQGQGTISEFAEFKGINVMGEVEYIAPPAWLTTKTHIKLDSGEVVSRKYYDKLNPTAQRVLMDFGFKKFEDWVSKHPSEALGVPPYEIFSILKKRGVIPKDAKFIGISDKGEVEYSTPTKRELSVTILDKWKFALPVSERVYERAAKAAEAIGRIPHPTAADVAKFYGSAGVPVAVAGVVAVTPWPHDDLLTLAVLGGLGAATWAGWKMTQVDWDALSRSMGKVTGLHLDIPQIKASLKVPDIAKIRDIYPAMQEVAKRAKDLVGTIDLATIPKGSKLDIVKVPSMFISEAAVTVKGLDPHTGSSVEVGNVWVSPEKLKVATPDEIMRQIENCEAIVDAYRRFNEAIVETIGVAEVTDIKEAKRWAEQWEAYKEAVIAKKVALTPEQVALQIEWTREGMRLAAEAAERVRQEEKAHFDIIWTALGAYSIAYRDYLRLLENLSEARMSFVASIMPSHPKIEDLTGSELLAALSTQLSAKGRTVLRQVLQPEAKLVMMTDLEVKVNRAVATATQSALQRAIATYNKAIAKAATLTAAQTAALTATQAATQSAVQVAAAQAVAQATAQAAAKLAVQSAVKAATIPAVRTAVRAATSAITAQTATALRTFVGVPAIPFIPVIWIPLPDGTRRRMTRKEFEGAVAWKQGFIYKLIYPPYGKDNILHSTKPFRGVKVVKGAKSAALSIVRLGGQVPPEIARDMGIMDVFITTPRRGKPSIRFKRDVKQRTRVTRHITPSLPKLMGLR